MIVKVQRAVVPPDGPWLVYNEDHSYYAFMQPDVIPAVLHDIMGDDLKVYLDVDIDADGRMIIKDRVVEPDW